MTHFLDLWRGNRNGLQDWNSVQRSMDRLFDQMTRSMLTNEENAVFSPACDVDENATGYTLSMDIPGIPKDAIKIEVVDNTLLISGQRTEERKEDKKARHVVERFSGKFQRALSLPPGTDLAKIEAGYEHGVLKITIPKAEAAKTRSIPINETKVATPLKVEKKDTPQQARKSEAAA